MVCILFRCRSRRPQACRIENFISFSRTESHRVCIERFFAPKKTECRKFLKNMNLFVFFSRFVLNDLYLFAFVRLTI